MALSWSEQILPAGTQTVNVEMAYLDRSYIHLYLNDVEVRDFTWSSDTLLRLDAMLTDSTKVTVVRRTARDILYIYFAEGAAFIKENLDTQNTQFLHLAQELVEGRAIDGFFGEINMNGYKITNLAPGTALTDAANLGQVQEVSDRVTSLEQTVVVDTVSYPWYTIVSAETTSIAPPFIFNKAAVYINGVCQTPGYSYDVISNVIHLADPVPAGTHVFVRLGEDVPDSQGYATAASLAAVSSTVTALNTVVNGKLDDTANAVSATKLATARTFQTNLASTATASFNGTANAAPGVTGVLPLANGGTGADTAAAARTTLGAAASGANADITSLTNLTGGITGTVLASAASAGVVGEQLTFLSPSPVTLTTGVAANVAAMTTLTAGDWDVSCNLQLTNSSTVTSRSFGISTTSATLPSLWYAGYSTTANLTGGVTAIPGTTVRISVAATTTIYLVANVAFSGTCTALGYIRARRMR